MGEDMVDTVDTMVASADLLNHLHTMDMVDMVDTDMVDITEDKPNTHLPKSITWFPNETYQRSTSYQPQWSLQQKHFKKSKLSTTRRLLICHLNNRRQRVVIIIECLCEM